MPAPHLNYAPNGPGWTRSLGGYSGMGDMLPMAQAPVINAPQGQPPLELFVGDEMPAPLATEGRAAWEAGPAPWEIGVSSPGMAPEMAPAKIEALHAVDQKAVQAAQAAKVAADNAARAAKVRAPRVAATHAATARAAAAVAAQSAKTANGQAAATQAAQEATRAQAAANIANAKANGAGLSDWLELGAGDFGMGLNPLIKYGLLIAGGWYLIQHGKKQGWF